MRRIALTLAASTLLITSLTGCPMPDGSSMPGGNSSGSGGNAVTPGDAGTLDKTFGDDGIVTTDFTEERSDIAYGVALQPDGKIVAAGVTSAPDPAYTTGTFAIVRYLSNGEEDATFGTQGRAFTAKGSTTQGKALALQGDGKIVTSGWYQGTGFAIDFLMSRHLADGKLDETFGDAGHATAGYGVAIATAMTTQADGKLLVLGYGGTLIDDDALIVRYTADGKLDESFGENGKVSLSWDTGSDQARALAARDGKIIVAGSSETHGFVVSRLNSDGSLDTSFGTEGSVKVETGEDQASGLAIATDGTIVVAGDQRIMRITAEGEVDTSFGTEGTVERSDHQLTAVAIQPDGKILATGGQGAKVVLLRLSANGKPDAGFASQGQVSVAVPDASAIAYALALQPDGRIVLAGKAFQNAGAQDDFMLMRFWP